MNRQEEVEAKLLLVRAWLQHAGATAVVLASQSNFAWLTAGGHSHIVLGEEAGVASVLVTSGEAYILTTNIELQRLLDEEVQGLRFETVEYPWHEPDAARQRLRALCDTSKAVSDLGTMGLEEAGPGLVELRRTLLEPELDRYRLLGEATGRALESACGDVMPGDVELDVAARVAAECLKEDILPLVNLVAADDRIAAYRQPLPTRNRVTHTLLAAVTGRRQGLHASVTRMIALGLPDDELLARHRAVAKIDARLILASTPGVSLGWIMRAAMKQYADEGFDGEWRLHHQGGLTGYAGREVLGTPDSTYEVKANQALAWNPSITRVKSEDTIVVTDAGHEIITRTGEWPEDVVEIDVGSVARPSLLER